MSRGPREPEADRRIRGELGNFRAAHRAVETDDVDAAVAITVALDWPTSVRDLPEIWAWARRLVTHPGLEGDPRQVEVLGAAATGSWLSGDLDAGARLAERGLAIDPDAARCAFALATISLFRGDMDRARSLYLRAAATEPVAYSNAACVSAYAGDTEGAERLIAEGMPLVEASGGPTDLSVHHHALGETRAPQARAAASYELAIELTRRSGAGFLEGVAEVGLVSVRAAHGEVERPLRSYRRLVTYWARTGNWAQQWVTLENLASLLVRLGEDLLECMRARAADDDRDNAFFTADFADLVDVGYLRAAVPVDHGGWGLTLAELAQQQRRLARYSPAAALATCMHHYWVGAAADLDRAGYPGVGWIVDDAVSGEVFASGHAESGNDVPILVSTTTAERVEGGYRLSGRKHFTSLSPVWTRLGGHAVVADPSEGPVIIQSFFRRQEIERLHRDVRAGSYHPPTDAYAREVIGKAALGVGPDEPRW